MFMQVAPTTAWQTPTAGLEILAMGEAVMGAAEGVPRSASWVPAHPAHQHISFLAWALQAGCFWYGEFRMGRFRLD
jgi:hypothetical protein